MRLAVINQHADIGGVETFLLSLLPQLALLGHEPELIVLDPLDRARLLPALRQRGLRVSRIGELSRAARPARFDAVLATNPATLCRAARALERGDLRADRFLVGVYQTRMFCLDRGPLDLHNRIAGVLFRAFDPSNVIFGNEACKAEHATAAPALATAPVVPLIVDTARFPRRPRLSRRGAMRIVSIGHLLPFKSYNLSMPDVLARLRRAGHDAVWEVYGEGPLEAAMRRRVAELSLSAHVRLHGTLPYHALSDALADAFAFVGSGLSLMEAAALGVPAIAAIEYADRAQSYGFVQQIRGSSFFEPGLPWTRHDIAELLQSLADLDEASYEAVGDEGRARMDMFSGPVVAREYERIMQTASLHRPTLGRFRDTVQLGSAAVHRTGRVVLGALIS